MNTEIKILKTNRGKMLLHYENFFYIQKNKNLSTIRWNCRKNRSQKCLGALTTNIEMTVATCFKEHNHCENEDSLEVYEIRLKMKNEALGSNPISTNNIIGNVLHNSGTTMRENIGQISSIRRSLNRYIRIGLPSKPKSFEDISFNDQSMKVGGGDNLFLISHRTMEPRMLIFSTTEGLKALAKAKTWYMDGSFAMAPELFSQIYTIHVPLDESCITTVYALLENKSFLTYQTLLSEIMSVCNSRQLFPLPNTFMMDFEKVMIKAIKDSFGMNVNIKLCNFLKQNIYRNLKEL